MKITTFDPEIISNNADPIIRLFEELGFERRHTKKNVDNRNVTIVRMRDANGFHIDIVNDPDIKQDKTVIRMNTDEYGEVYELLSDHGFRNIKYNEEAVFTENAKQSIMISPSGFEIDLCHHIKDIFYHINKAEKLKKTDRQD